MAHTVIKQDIEIRKSSREENRIFQTTTISFESWLIYIFTPLHRKNVLNSIYILEAYLKSS